MHIKLFFAGIVVRIQYIIRSIKAINQPHLGDIVIYHGKRHSLIQGVNHPYWDLMDLSVENMAKPVRDIERHVHVSQLKLQPLYKRFIFSFMFTYKFLIGYWYSIDVRNFAKK